DRVRAEIAAGADVNGRDDLGATPLHDAAWNGHVEVAAFLLDRGADVKARHLEGGSTPLAYAVIKNNLAMVALLLSKGAVVRVTDSNGETPLHLAASRGYAVLAERLIAAGAPIAARANPRASPPPPPAGPPGRGRGAGFPAGRGSADRPRRQGRRAEPDDRCQSLDHGRRQRQRRGCATVTGERCGSGRTRPVRRECARARGPLAPNRGG